jgi:hypothetical protein
MPPRHIASRYAIGEHEIMTTPSVQAQVVDLIASQSGAASDTIRTTDRLVDDLGMSANDADALFKQVRQRFGTDLRPLYRRWNHYFSPRLTPGCAFVLFFVVLASPLALFMMPLVLLAAIAVTLLFWLASLWWRSRRLPVTVGDVVAAVEAGAWPAPHADAPSTPTP